MLSIIGFVIFMSPLCGLGWIAWTDYQFERGYEPEILVYIEE